MKGKTIVCASILSASLLVGMLFPSNTYAEETNTTASITFIDTSPVPKNIDIPDPPNTESVVYPPSSENRTYGTSDTVGSMISKVIPQTGSEISWLWPVVGSEMLLIVWLLIWKRRKQDDKK